MDVHRLIAEVRRNPALWDVRLPDYKDRTHSTLLWQGIADNLGCEVEQCKRKWKNLRDAYRAEVRRTERRVERLKLEGNSDPQVSDSKWVYFQPMSFMNDSKRRRHSAPATPPEHSNDSHVGFNLDIAENADMQSFCDIKMEPHNSTDGEGELHDRADCDDTPIGDDDDDENEMLFEQFKSVATPQAARRLSGTLTMGGGIAPDSPTAAVATSSSSPLTATPSTAIAPIMSNNGHAHARPIHSNNNNKNCKCNAAEDQVHFLEDLEREEQKLMQSTRRDITRSHNISHVGDPDYNFLVSFLPQMKRMSELQNLQFRAKMSELMLNIMAPAAALAPLPLPVSTTSPSSTFACISPAATPIMYRCGGGNSDVTHTAVQTHTKPEQ